MFRAENFVLVVVCDIFEKREKKNLFLVVIFTVFFHFRLLGVIAHTREEEIY
jgi:hypothetical protein